MRPGIDPARLRPARMSRPHLPAPDRRFLLLALGAGAVLLKGGHLEGDPMDVLAEGTRTTTFRSASVPAGS